MTPASTRTRDRGANRPRSSVPPQWQATTHYPENMGRHLRWPPRRPADGQQRAALRERVTGHQEGSRGLIIPSLRMLSTAPAGGLIPLVPARVTEVHISSPVSSTCLRAKDHLEGTKVAVSPTRKTRPAAQPEE